MANDGGKEANVDLRMVGFAIKLGDNQFQHVNGHAAWLSNPRNHFTITAPLPGGCGTLQRVSDMAKKHNPKCRFATNAGMFNTTSKQCFGNLVANGQVLKTVPLNETNVAFGIKNGEYVVGYVSPDDIAAGGFEELVNGLGWLVKDGNNYIDESWVDAYKGVQTSGPGDAYKEMRSGRTAIGHDIKGRLLIFQVDGDRGVHPYGMTLHEVADHLIKFFNITNAIALDSGGSTSFAKDGQFINYPSDQYPPSCPQLPPFECERPTSTALCIYDSDDALGSIIPFASIGGYATAIASGALIGALAVSGFLTYRGKSHSSIEGIDKELSDTKELTKELSDTSDEGEDYFPGA